MTTRPENIRKMIRERFRLIDTAKANQIQYEAYKQKVYNDPENVRSNKKRALLQVCYYIEIEIKDKKLDEDSEKAMEIYKKSSEVLSKGLEIFILQDLGYIDTVIQDFVLLKDNFIHKQLEAKLNEIDLSKIKYKKVKNTLYSINNVINYYSIQIHKLFDLCSKVTYKKNDVSAYEQLFINLSKVNKQFKAFDPNESKITL